MPVRRFVTARCVRLLARSSERCAAAALPLALALAMTATASMAAHTLQQFFAVLISMRFIVSYTFSMRVRVLWVPVQCTSHGRFDTVIALASPCAKKRRFLRGELDASTRRQD